VKNFPVKSAITDHQVVFTRYVNKPYTAATIIASHFIGSDNMVSLIDKPEWNVETLQFNELLRLTVKWKKQYRAEAVYNQVEKCIL